MRAAIAGAEVGDDVLEKDPTVGMLERRVAELLGKEAALFVPSGTMANQISIRLHTVPGREVIVDHLAHVVHYEAGAAAALSGVTWQPLAGDRGTLSADAVRDAVRPPVPHLPVTALVWVENTHNSAGGSVWPLSRLDAVAEAAHEAGLPLHLDGARLWNACVAGGDTPARIAAGADTVSVCMSKGLGAPVGSLIVGPAELMERAWVLRKQMGGGMRQSGLLAAAALHGLEHNFDKLAEDHANARALAERLAPLPGVAVDLEATQTNIVIFDVGGTGHDALQVAARAEERGVRIVPFGGSRLRAVTHLDVNRDDVLHAADCLEALLEPVAGAAP
ncbi:MAG: aminotransferase class I/II-fold pyridoxal phosphate-dependent enzyme [Gemmatimonadetes bacterium]|nr:aminotransferase class I/II-fold pyridoxal phosphate-dependent enzyme [Gemmatimonadota bacterium]